jgi:hypothetical protein
MPKMKKKSQILILTLFVMFVSLSTVLVLLIPVNYQLVRVRKIIYSFQAFSEAESNLEIGNLYVTRKSKVQNYNYIENDLGDLSKCQAFGEKVGINPDIGWTYYYCIKIEIVPNNNPTSTEIYYSAVYPPGANIGVYSFYSKLISEGNYKGLKRVLDFDFLP